MRPSTFIASTICFATFFTLLSSEPQRYSAGKNYKASSSTAKNEPAMSLSTSHSGNASREFPPRFCSEHVKQGGKIAAYSISDPNLNVVPFSSRPVVEGTLIIPKPSLLPIDPLAASHNLATASLSTIQNCPSTYASIQPIPHVSSAALSNPAKFETNYKVRNAVFNQTNSQTRQPKRIGLLQYRRMMKSGKAPTASELVGSWRGTNTGVATLAIDKEFIKRFTVVGNQIYGDNLSLPQTTKRRSRRRAQNGLLSHNHKSHGKFLVQPAGGRGPFRQGLRLTYSAGGNRSLDPANLINDRVVKLDDNHMLGRATAKFGPIQIPLAYFVLERIQN